MGQMTVGQMTVQMTFISVLRTGQTEPDFYIILTLWNELETL